MEQRLLEQLQAEAAEYRRELLAHLPDLTQEAYDDARALARSLCCQFAPEVGADDGYEPSDEILELAKSLWADAVRLHESRVSHAHVVEERAL